MGENEEAASIVVEDYLSDDDSVNKMHTKDIGQSSSKESERKRTQKTTGFQMEKMKQFMKDNPIFAEKQLKPEKIKDYYANMWDKLSTQLNTLGPPIRTVVEWKKIWSDHKGNKKRKVEATSIRAPLDNVNRYETPEDTLCSGTSLKEIIENDPKESFGSELVFI